MIRTSEELLRRTLLKAESDANFTEAVLLFQDASRLCFCHRVGERWSKAVGPEGNEQNGGIAGQLLAAMTMFRLNAKHLDIQFCDGSRWDEAVTSRDSADA